MWKLFQDRLSPALRPSVILDNSFHFCTSDYHFGDFLVILKWAVLLNI